MRAYRAMKWPASSTGIRIDGADVLPEEGFEGVNVLGLLSISSGTLGFEGVNVLGLLSISSGTLLSISSVKTLSSCRDRCKLRPRAQRTKMCNNAPCSLPHRD